MDHNTKVKTETPTQTQLTNLQISDLCDDPGILSQNLNAVILQYFESCGLEESYTTFSTECKTKGVPIPSHLPDPTFSKHIFKQTDAKAILESFDGEDGDKLIESWDDFIKILNCSSEEIHTIGGITFHINVFAAIIPYRQNQAEEEKAKGMEQLRQFFQYNSAHIYADSDMLALYALPYVPDSKKHEIFKDLFEDSWKTNLRNRISNVFSQYFEIHTGIPGSDSQLTQVFLSYIQEGAKTDDGTESEAMEEGRGTSHSRKQAKVSMTTQPTQTDRPITVPAPAPVAPICSDAQIQTDETNTNLNAKYTQLNNALQNAYSQNHRLNVEIQEVKAKLYQTEDRYYKLIQSTAEVVGSLELAVQGKFQSIDALSERLLQVFPELFSQSKLSKALENSAAVQTRLDKSIVTAETETKENLVTPRPGSSTSIDVPMHAKTTSNQKRSDSLENQEVNTNQSRIPSSMKSPVTNASEGYMQHDQKGQRQRQSNTDFTRTTQSDTHYMQQQQQQARNKLLTAGSTQKINVDYNQEGSPRPRPLFDTPAPPSRNTCTPNPSGVSGPSGVPVIPPAHIDDYQKHMAPVSASARTGTRSINMYDDSSVTAMPVQQGGGPPLMSLCPSNLRAKFQPVNIRPTNPAFTGNTAALRTETRTIQQHNMNQPVATHEAKIMPKSKKNFRRDGSRRKDETEMKEDSYAQGEKSRRHRDRESEKGSGHHRTRRETTAIDPSTPLDAAEAAKWINVTDRNANVERKGRGHGKNNLSK